MDPKYRNGITAIPSSRRALDEGRSWVVSFFGRGPTAIPASTTFFWTLINRSIRKGLWLYHPKITTPQNFILGLHEDGVYTSGGFPYSFLTANPVPIFNRKRTDPAEDLEPYFAIYPQAVDLVHIGGEDPFTQSADHDSPTDIPAVFLGPNKTFVLSLENLTTGSINWGIELLFDQDYV